MSSLLSVMFALVKTVLVHVPVGAAAPENVTAWLLTESVL
jgi:hypothetical protein